MNADGKTCRSRQRVVTVNLNGTERIKGGPHTVIASVETKVVTATREAMSITSPSWVILSF